MKIGERIARLPIKWKYMIWSSAMLLVLLFVYNGVQYLMLSHWTISREKESMHKIALDVQAYFAEEQFSAEQMASEQPVIEKMLAKHQSIRIFTHEGVPVLLAGDDVLFDRIIPQPALQERLLRLLRLKNQVIMMRWPLATEQFRGTIEVFSNLLALNQLVENNAIIMGIGGTIALMLSFGGGLVLSRQLIKPLQNITSAMKQIKNEGLHRRVPPLNSKDELSYLVTAINGLMDKVELAFQRQQHFIEDASHELRTPIAIMEGHLSLLQRWGKHDRHILDESLHAALQEVRRLKALVEDLLSLSDMEHIDGDLMQFSELLPQLEEIVNDIRIVHPEFTIQLNIAAELSQLPLHVAPHHFKQIILIFIDNAIKYSTDDKVIQIEGERWSDQKVAIRIIDRGIGIAEAHLPYIFDRFYRVDKARSRKLGSSGLGLAIAKRMVKPYGGHILIESKEHVGTTATIILPIAK